MKQDRPLYTFTPSEGEEFEPDNMLPIFPLHLANGVEGVGTGWSTYIPPHNPLDLIDYLIARINQVTENDPLPKFKPWFRGFKGKVEIRDRTKEGKQPTDSPLVLNISGYAGEEPSNNSTVFKFEHSNLSAVAASSSGSSQDQTQINMGSSINYNEGPNSGQMDDISLDLMTDGIDITEALDELDDFDPKAKYYLRTEGTFTFHINGDIEITELPIRRWNVPYRQWLDKLIQDGTISGYTKRSTTHTANFLIHGMKAGVMNVDKLRLVKTWGMRNIVMINEKFQPMKFDHIYQCIDYFYSWRIKVYYQRKEYILNTIKSDIETKTYKKTFVYLVAVTKDIKVMNTPISVTQDQMTTHNIPHDIYEQTKAKEFSRERIAQLESEIQKLTEKYNEINMISAGQMWMNDLLAFKTEYLKRVNKPSFFK